MKRTREHLVLTREDVKKLAEDLKDERWSEIHLPLVFKKPKLYRMEEGKND